MLKSVYDSDEDGVIAVPQTEADMTKAVYDTDNDGKVDAIDEHASTHQDGQTDEINVTGLTGTHQYIDRGVAANPDFTQATLTTDETWNELDLSSIVGAGATFAYIKLSITDATPDLFFGIRKKGVGTTHTIFAVRNQVANIAIFAYAFVPLDENLKAEYMGTNTTFDAIAITVCGWLV